LPFFSFNPKRALSAIPTVVAPYGEKWHYDVSIPNGLCRPFRQGVAYSRQGRRACFNPKRALSAIPTLNGLLDNEISLLFQSQTGFVGHSDCGVCSVAYMADLCKRLREARFLGGYCGKILGVLGRKVG
jgi:hypothetical protein